VVGLFLCENDIVIVLYMKMFYSRRSRKYTRRIFLDMLHTPLGRFRTMGFLEGGSLLFLVFIALPLKYFVDLPQVVSVVGAVHGGLFVLYLLVIAYTTYKIRWSYKWVLSAFIVAFIPFGNLVLDNQLKKQNF
jgi:integral membrane protein